MDESKQSDDFLAKLSQDMFGSGRSVLAEELEEIEREEAARRRKWIVIGSVAGLVAVIAVFSVAWWLFA